MTTPACPNDAGDKWHMDEVVLTIAGVKHRLRRAIDQNAMVLDILVQSRRDTEAARRLLRKPNRCRPRMPPLRRSQVADHGTLPWPA